MAEVIIVTQVDRLEVMIFILLVEMVDKEDHSMVEVIIITLGVAEENILTMPVPILVQSRRF